VIRAGGTKAFVAARSLPHISNTSSASQEFAREGTVQSLVRLCCRASSEELEGVADVALEICLGESPDALTQYINEFSDANPQRFLGAALTLSKKLVVRPHVRERLLGDEVFTARLVGLLSTPFLFFQSFMVCTISDFVAAWPMKSQGFLKAGLVRKLVHILRKGCLPEQREEPHDGTFASLDNLFSGFKGRAAARRAHPAICASNNLSILVNAFAEVRQEVLETPNLASTFVSLLNEFKGLEDARMQLLKCICELVEITDNTTDAQHSFASELVSSGFGHIVSSLTTPILGFANRVVYQLLALLGTDGIRLMSTSQAYYAGLLRYVESDCSDAIISRPACALALIQLAEKLGMFKELKSEALVREMAHVLVKGKQDRGMALCVIAGLVQRDEGTNLLRVALSQSFLPACLTLFREEHLNTSSRSDGGTHAKHVYFCLLQLLMYVIALRDLKPIKQAINRQLLSVLHKAIRQDTYQAQIFSLFCVTSLTEHREALEKMRSVGLWPAGFLELARSKVYAILPAYIAVLRRLVNHRPSLVTELLAADVLSGSNCIEALKIFVSSCPVPMQGKMETDLQTLESWVAANKQGIDQRADGLRRGERFAVRCPKASLPFETVVFWEIASLRVNLPLFNMCCSFQWAFLSQRTTPHPYGAYVVIVFLVGSSPNLLCSPVFAGPNALAVFSVPGSR
jgi:hypothetical protein